VPLLRPEEQVFNAMLDGWRNQQLARNLAFSTAGGRERVVRAFAVRADAFPWQWTPLLAGEWCTDLRAVRGLRRSALRQYQEPVRMLCDCLTGPEYGWAEQCIARSGTHPVQVCHERNTAVHAQQAEGDPVRRAFTQDELQALLDYAGGQVARVRAAGRKGWLAAFRDAVLVKAACACGLRRREVRMPDVAGSGRNPKAPGFGDYGVCYVRYGKAKKGSPPRRRSVLTAWERAPEILGQRVSEVRPLMAAEGNPALRPSERAPRVGLQQIDARFAACRDALGPGPGADFRSLRRSHVTRLIEAGRDAVFVQQQAGHEHASTTSICVSPDYRTRTLRTALDQAIAGATGTAGGRR
jgi:site-specific recombinase XerC